jgi:hypothetical protein
VTLLSVTEGMKSDLCDAHDDVPAPRILTAHMAWIKGPPAVHYEGQILNCSCHAPDFSS